MRPLARVPRIHGLDQTKINPWVAVVTRPQISRWDIPGNRALYGLPVTFKAVEEPQLVLFDRTTKSPAELVLHLLLRR